MLFEIITNTEIKQVILINKKHLFKCYKSAITLSEIDIDSFVVSKLIWYATALLFGRFFSPFQTVFDTSSYSSLKFLAREPCLPCFLCFWYCRGLYSGRTFLWCWWISFSSRWMTPLVSCSWASSPFTMNFCPSSSSSLVSALARFPSVPEKWQRRRST